MLSSSDGPRDRPDEAISERAVGAATRSLLEAAATGAGRPVLVAVDDAPWLDSSSERALRFALRRVVPRVGALVTARSGAADSAPEVPLGLDQGPAGHQVVRIDLGPLSIGALHHVLRARLGVTLGRPLLSRIAREVGGNPLVAIEVARAVLRQPRRPRPGEDLPVASSMQHLLTDALAALPATSRDSVRLVALLTVPTLRDLASAGVEMTALDPAEEAGLLAVHPETVEFAHPVYAAAVRASIPPGVRRRLHRRLADMVADPDERARQLSQGTVAPDGLVARELEDAAARHRARGAPAAAADLYDRAAALTPIQAGAESARRRLAAVRCRFDSGDYAAAGAAADAAAAELDGEFRAEALLLRAMVSWSVDDPGNDAVTAAERALASVPSDSRQAGRIHAHLSVFVDQPVASRRHAEAAIALLEGSDEDRGLHAPALLTLVLNEVRAGLPLRTELLERAIELEGGEPSWLAGTIPAILWSGLDDHGRARARLLMMLDRATARGDEPAQHELLCHLSETETLAGRWSVARKHVAALMELGEQLGTGLISERFLAGLVAAHEGRLADAAVIAEAGLRFAEQTGDAWCRRVHLRLNAFVALSAGRMAEAAAAYEEIANLIDDMGLVESLALRFEPDWIEVCVASGDLDTARAALSRLTERHRRLPRPWTTLGLARSTALLDSASGADPAPALAALVAAREAVPADVLPFDRARCLLVAGMVHRRGKQKRAARQALTSAVAEFTALGASAFADRARAELARIGGRPTQSFALTPTEERVARLAAQGRTNRLIADALFISPKTVEANLARVYRKLGISSRAELGAAMAAWPAVTR